MKLLELVEKKDIKDKTKQLTDDAWDRQMAKDFKSGVFDKMMDEIDAEIDAGNVKPK